MLLWRSSFKTLAPLLLEVAVKLFSSSSRSRSRFEFALLCRSETRLRRGVEAHDEPESSEVRAAKGLDEPYRDGAGRSSGRSISIRRPDGARAREIGGGAVIEGVGGVGLLY